MTPLCQCRLKRHIFVAGRFFRLFFIDWKNRLANRAMFYDKLEFMINLCERSNDQFALIMIDFDKFKEINDSKGHLYGDALLKAFALRLNEISRKSDYCARFGGDEFLMIVTHFNNPEHLR